MLCVYCETLRFQTPYWDWTGKIWDFAKLTKRENEPIYYNRDVLTDFFGQGTGPKFIWLIQMEERSFCLICNIHKDPWKNSEFRLDEIVEEF